MNRVSRLDRADALHADMLLVRGYIEQRPIAHS